jgi:hypothetical protein
MKSHEGNYPITQEKFELHYEQDETHKKLIDVNPYFTYISNSYTEGRQFLPCEMYLSLPQTVFQEKFISTHNLWLFHKQTLNEKKTGFRRRKSPFLFLGKNGKSQRNEISKGKPQKHFITSILDKCNSKKSRILPIESIKSISVVVGICMFYDRYWVQPEWEGT